MSDESNGFDFDALFAERIDRGKLLKRAVAGGAAVTLAPWVATSRAFAATRTVRIGYVTPRTGAYGEFGAADVFVIDQMKTVFSRG
jgi:branched-chain amino acid transport system substrate-binding protein